VQRREPKSKSKPQLQLYDRARAEIVRNLGVGTLSPEAIAGKLRVSRTTLYNLFKARGGIQAYIRECRLHACYESLASDLRPHETIGAIAADYGFPREAHFSRVFKQRYGVTPKQMRMIGRNRRVAIEPARQDAMATVLMATLGDA
jgi:AraC-like DNA-binding protein